MFLGGNFALFAIFKLKFMKIDAFITCEFYFAIKYSKNSFAWSNYFYEEHSPKVLTSAKNFDFARIYVQKPYFELTYLKLEWFKAPKTWLT